MTFLLEAKDSAIAAGLRPTVRHYSKKEDKVDEKGTKDVRSANSAETE